jgi:hypothetical protein
MTEGRADDGFTVAEREASGCSMTEGPHAWTSMRECAVEADTHTVSISEEQCVAVGLVAMDWTETNTVSSDAPELQPKTSQY